MSLEEASIVPLKDVVKRVKVGFVGSCNDDYCSPEVGVPMIRTTNLTKEGIKLENLKYINNKFHVSHIKSQLNFGDILIARHGHNGLASLWEYKFDAQCLNVVVVEPNESLADKYYLTYLINSPLIQQQIKSLTGGSVQSVVNTKDIADLLIPVPPLSKQKEIANFILLFNKKIAINKSINKNLVTLAKTIFRDKFIFYKGYESHMIKTDFGEIPDTFEVKSIDEISKEVICGKTPSTKVEENYGNKMPFITIPDMHGNVFVINTERKLSEIGIQSQIKKILPKNSICVSCIATAGLVSLTSEESQTNQQINSIICKDSVSPYFVYLYMEELSEYVKMLGSGGSTTLNLNKREFGKIELVIPPQKDMIKFHGQISPLFDKIKSNQYEINYLTKLRDTLLPKLMSGELDVSEINCDLE